MVAKKNTGPASDTLSASACIRIATGRHAAGEYDGFPPATMRPDRFLNMGVACSVYLPYSITCLRLTGCQGMATSTASALKRTWICCCFPCELRQITEKYSFFRHQLKIVDKGGENRMGEGE